LLVASCAGHEPEPFDLERAVAQWQQTCTVVAPIGSPENNACVLQRHDMHKLLMAQRAAAIEAAYASRLGAYSLVTRGY
jgi:hypothetical protein